MSKIDETLGDPTLVFVIGGPGAGKTSLCKTLAEKINFGVISVGDLLRKDALEGDMAIREQISKGDPVSTHTAVIEVAKALHSRKGDEEPSVDGWIIDNFPLTLEQAVDAGRYLTDPKLVLFLDADTDLLSERFHKAVDLSHSEGEDTIDSSPEILDSRIETFVDAILPVVEYYDTKGILKEVNAAQSFDSVLHEAKAVLREADLVLRPTTAPTEN